MRVDVAFTPALLAEPERKVAIVIDVLRASSSIVAMFARGLDELLVAETVAEARRLAAGEAGLLLCGEEGGLPPAGFDYGNSPSEFAALDLRGRRAVLATSNGTAALARAASCPVVLVGALLNLRGAASAALAEARSHGLDVSIVCAGNSSGRHFSLEDAFCAGAVVAELIANEPAVRPWSSATAALRLYRSFRGSARRAFAEGDHAAGLAALGFGRDLALCARRNRYTVAPRLVRGVDGLLRVAGG